MIHNFVLGNLKYFSYVTFKVYVVTTHLNRLVTTYTFDEK